MYLYVGTKIYFRKPTTSAEAARFFTFRFFLSSGNVTFFPSDSFILCEKAAEKDRTAEKNLNHRFFSWEII